MTNVLIVNPVRSGVDLYRLTPYRLLDKDKYVVNETPHLNTDDKELYKSLKPYDVVVFSRMLSNSDKDCTDNLMMNLEKAGCKVVVDFDDSWKLPNYHDLKDVYKRHNMVQRQRKACRFADVVTCSTPYLSERLKKLNDNVVVINNCVNTYDEQFNPMFKFKTPSERLRVGFIGGNSHVKDIESILPEFEKIKSLDVDLIYGGWATSEQNDKIASIMSCKGSNKNFDVLPALDVNCYGQMYNHIDICLAPLYKDDFTQSKSELKVIEAGTMGCAVIASNQLPFTYVCNEHNSILVEPDGWYNALKYLVDNPSKIEELAGNLYTDVQKHYNIDEWTKVREAVINSLS